MFYWLASYLSAMTVVPVTKYGGVEDIEGVTLVQYSHQHKVDRYTCKPTLMAPFQIWLQTPARWIFTLQDLENAYWLLGEGLWILQATGWKQRLRANIKNFDSFTTHLLSYGWSFSVISLWILLFVLLKFIVIYNIVFLLNTDWEGFLFWRNQQIKKKVISKSVVIT